MAQAKQAAKAPEKKEIVKVPPKVTSIQTAPAYLDDLDRREGFEEVSQSDIKIPRLALCQKGNPQLEEGQSVYIEGLKQGQWFNTISQHVYGNEVKFVPLLKFGTRIYFADLDSGGGILCRSDDMKIGVGEPGGVCAKCPFSQFKSARGGAGKGTACSEFFNFPIVLVDNEGRIIPDSSMILSMKSSHIDAAKQIISKANARRKPMYAGIYSMTSTLKTFGKNTSYIPVVDNAGWVAEADLAAVRDSYTFMREFREKNRDVFDTTNMNEEINEPGASDESNN